jgi:hypothetical protein
MYDRTRCGVFELLLSAVPIGAFGAVVCKYGPVVEPLRCEESGGIEGCCREVKISAVLVGEDIICCCDGALSVGSASPPPPPPIVECDCRCMNG